MKARRSMCLRSFTSRFSSTISREMASIVDRCFDRGEINIARIGGCLLSVSSCTHGRVGRCFRRCNLRLAGFSIRKVGPRRSSSGCRRVLRTRSRTNSVSLRDHTLTEGHRHRKCSCRRRQRLSMVRATTNGRKATNGVVKTDVKLKVNINVNGIFKDRVKAITRDTVSKIRTPPPPPRSVRVCIYLGRRRTNPCSLPVLRRLMSRGLLARRALM